MNCNSSECEVNRVADCCANTGHSESLGVTFNFFCSSLCFRHFLFGQLFYTLFVVILMGLLFTGWCSWFASYVWALAQPKPKGYRAPSTCQKPIQLSFMTKNCIKLCGVFRYQNKISQKHYVGFTQISYFLGLQVCSDCNTISIGQKSIRVLKFSPVCRHCSQTFFELTHIPCPKKWVNPYRSFGF